MKGFRSRILRTLKSFHQVGPVKPGNGRVFLIEAPSDEFFDTSPSPVTSPPHSTPPVAAKEKENVEDELQVREQMALQLEFPVTPDKPIQVPTEGSSDKENVGPITPNKEHNFCKKAEEPTQFETTSPERADLGSGLPSYRRPNLNSSTLFDPNLLAAFREAVSDHNNQCHEEARTRTRSSEEIDRIEFFEPPTKIARTEVENSSSDDALAEFEVRCPTSGKECIILYTTSLRGIRKTFEDCNRVRFLLENLGVDFHERDISMDMGYREELWKVLGFRAIPPRLFITGHYIGGSEEVVGLHESGRLRPLVRPFMVGCNGPSCEGCGGMKFMMCSACNGSHSLYDSEEETKIPCLGCNENGLVACPLCS